MVVPFVMLAAGSAFAVQTESKAVDVTAYIPTSAFYVQAEAGWDTAPQALAYDPVPGTLMPVQKRYVAKSTEGAISAKLDSLIAECSRAARIFALWFVFLALATLFFLFLLSAKRERVIRLLNRAVGERNDLLQAERDLSRTLLFEIDPKTGEITFNKRFKEHFGREPAISNWNRFEAPNDHFYEEDAGLFKKLGEEMKRGLPKGKISARLCGVDGVPEWYTVSFVTIYDQDKHAPFRIVGRIEKI